MIQSSGAELKWWRRLLLAFHVAGHSSPATAPRNYAIRHSYTTQGNHRENSIIQHLTSLLYKNKSNPRIIHQLHSHLTTTGLILFRKQNSGTPVVFNSLIRCYSLGETPHQAYFLYQQLQQLHFLSDYRHRLPPFDSFTYLFLLKASSNSRFPSLLLGIGIHGLTLKLGYEFHVYVQTALVGMYLLGGNKLDAYQVFDEIPDKNQVTWNVMITGLTNMRDFENALFFLDNMQNRTVVSWTTIIDGYARANKPKEAILLFSRMAVSDNIKPNEITILSILPAVWSLGDQRMCASVHAYVAKRGFIPCDIRVTNSLIDSYAKCGCIQSSFKFFTEIPSKRKNLVSWTTIISAFAMHGMGKEALNIFKDMESSGLSPNRVTMISLLNACSHGGLTEEFLEIFDKMLNHYKITPDVKHYGCLVDMLRRKGRLKEAEKIALEIPTNQKAVIWRMILAACSIYDDAEMAERVTRKLMELERSHGGDYVLMSNIFCGIGKFKDGQRFRRLMDARGAVKSPGHSQVT